MVYVYDSDLLQQTNPDSTAMLKEFKYFLRGGGFEAFIVLCSAPAAVSSIHSFCFERNLERVTAGRQFLMVLESGGRAFQLLNSEDCCTDCMAAVDCDLDC